MLERDIERRLTALVRRKGGLTYKFTSPGNVGVPDRIVITPRGEVWFVELKTEAGQLSPMQRHQLERLRGMGCNVVVTYGWEETRAVLEAVFHGV